MKKAFTDTKRRATQQVLQTLGVVKGTDDNEFQEETDAYRTTVGDIKQIKKLMQDHLHALQKSQASTVALAMALAKFYKNTSFEESAKQYLIMQLELERVQLSSLERLFEERVYSEPDDMLNQVSEIEDKIKQRKGLLLDYNAHHRKYETARAHEESVSQQGQGQKEEQTTPSRTSTRFGAGGTGTTSMFSRKKTEADLADETLHRKTKMEQAEMAMNSVSAELKQKFQDISNKKKEGALLRTPVSALFACQEHFFRASQTKLNSIENLFPLNKSFEPTLQQYDSEFAKSTAEEVALAAASSSQLSERVAMSPRSGSMIGFDGFGKKRVKNLNSKHTSAIRSEQDAAAPTGYFGKALTKLSPSSNPSAPSLIYDCLEYLESHDGLNLEGIFRIPGAQDVVNDVRKLYDANENNVDMGSMKSVDCHDVGTLLKMYFRDIPEPLVPSSHYDKLMNAAKEAGVISKVLINKQKNGVSLDDDEDGRDSDEENESDDAGAGADGPMDEAEIARRKVKAVRNVCNIAKDFPPQHVVCLGVLLHFLDKVSKNAEKNKMNTANLATCFAPSLIRAPMDIPPQQALRDMQFAILAMKILIENYSEFPNPPRVARKDSTVRRGSLGSPLTFFRKASHDRSPKQELKGDIQSKTSSESVPGGVDRSNNGDDASMNFINDLAQQDQ